MRFWPHLGCGAGRVPRAEVLPRSRSSAPDPKPSPATSPRPTRLPADDAPDAQQARYLPVTPIVVFAPDGSASPRQQGGADAVGAGSPRGHGRLRIGAGELCGASDQQCLGHWSVSPPHGGVPAQAPGTAGLGDLADDVAPPRLPSHLDAPSRVLGADALGGVFVARDYPVTAKARVTSARSWRCTRRSREWGMTCCYAATQNQHNSGAPGKSNTRTTRTKRYCPASGGTLAKMAVLAHGSPHAGQTG